MEKQNYLLQTVLKDVQIHKFKDAFINGNHVETEKELVVIVQSKDTLNLREVPITDKQLILCVFCSDGNCLYYKVTVSI